MTDNEIKAYIDSRIEELLAGATEMPETGTGAAAPTKSELEAYIDSKMEELKANMVNVGDLPEVDDTEGVSLPVLDSGDRLVQVVVGEILRRVREDAETAYKVATLMSVFGMLATTTDTGLHIVDAEGNVCVRYDGGGLDTLSLSAHLQELIRDISGLGELKAEIMSGKEYDL